MTNESSPSPATDSPTIEDDQTADVLDLSIDLRDRRGSGPRLGVTRETARAESISSSVIDDDEQLVGDIDLPPVEAFAGNWLTVAQAAQLLQQSEATVRRKLKSGELEGRMAFDQSIGTNRWMVDAGELTNEHSQSATLVPMAAIDRLEKAWGDTRDAIARAETAERVAVFERERRIEAEQERDRLRSLLAAENELAQRVAELEKSRRIQVEKERDRLRTLLEVEPQNSWWVRMRERFRL
jgi:hypothetical protein